jgi:hypothetical protein
MKAGGPYHIYPAILSQVRNPPAVIHSMIKVTWILASSIPVSFIIELMKAGGPYRIYPAM